MQDGIAPRPTHVHQEAAPSRRVEPFAAPEADVRSAALLNQGGYSQSKFTRDSRKRRPTAISTLSRPAIRSRHDKSDAGPAFREAANQAIHRWGWRAGRLPSISRRCARRSHQQQPRHRLGRVADSEEQTRRSGIDLLAEAERQQIHRKRRSAGMRYHGGNSRGETGSDRLWRRARTKLHLRASGKP